MYLIGAVRGSEPAAIVDKDNWLILGGKMDVDDHIRLIISIDIAELHCNGSQIAAITVDIHGRNIIDRLRGVSTHEFNDDSLTIEIDGNEVAGVPRTFVMPYIGVGLIRAWHAIAKIIVALVSPGDSRHTKYPQDNSREYAHPKGEQPMHICALLDLPIRVRYVVWATELSFSSLLAAARDHCRQWLRARDAL